jgi:hypothetical protein
MAQSTSLISICFIPVTSGMSGETKGPGKVLGDEHQAFLVPLVSGRRKTKEQWSKCSVRLGRQAVCGCRRLAAGRWSR